MSKFRESGEEYEVAVIKVIDGVKTPVIETKRRTQKHCEYCDGVIQAGQYQEIEVWLNYNCEGTESDIMGFCSFKCLAEWAATQKPS